MGSRSGSSRKGTSRGAKPGGPLPKAAAAASKLPARPRTVAKAPAIAAAPDGAVLGFSHDSQADCLALAAQVAAVIRSFHSQVASPLASIGLQLELLRMNPATDEDVRAELIHINQRLDGLIDVIRSANRSLRDVEKQIRQHR